MSYMPASAYFPTGQPRSSPVYLESGDNSALKLKRKLQGRGEGSSDRNVLASVVKNPRTHVQKPMHVDVRL